MTIMKPEFLQQVLKYATVHDETHGTRIVYDTKSFSLTAEYSENDPFIYEAYDSDDNEVKLPPNQHQEVYKFVKDLHETEKQKQKDHQNYLD